MLDLFLGGLLLLLVDGVRVVFATLIGWAISFALPAGMQTRRTVELNLYKLLLYFAIGAVALTVFWTALTASLIY